MRARLQKVMAQSGLGSRRENERRIRAGRVRVNGRLAKLGDKVDPATDRVELDGAPVTLSREEPIYIALHKPKGVISTVEDEPEQERRTVRELVDLPGHLYPVGRLDKQSSGLILMTNDGDLAHKLTHPRYGHEKAYEVVIEGRPSETDLRQWRKGVWLDGRKTATAVVRVLEVDEQTTRLEIVLREGRKRQIRRVASQLGYTVVSLVRRRIGPLVLGELSPGRWRHLLPEEVAALRDAGANSKAMDRPNPEKRRNKGIA